MARIGIDPNGGPVSFSEYTPIDVDSGAGTLYALPITWRKTASGGPEFGTLADPVRVDPTGATVQPVSGSGNFSVLGTKTNNNAAPGATNVGALTGLANAAAPSWTEGNLVALSTDLAGNLRVTGGGGGTEYVVDVAAPAAPTGATFVMERDDQLAALTEIEGDWTNPRATSKGALWVALADASGDPITSFGGGTQYTEDAAATADPVGTQLISRRRDTLSATEVSADGDVIAVNATNKGELYVKHTDTIAVTQSGTWDEVGINDSGNSITVDNSTLSVVGGGTEATALRVTVASDSTGVLSVDDNGGALTVDNGGTFAVQESGAALTALQLIDDIVYVDDTGTHATGSSKGALIMAAATPTDGSVNANDIGAVAMTTDRKLHVAVMDALPAGTNGIGKLTANSGVDIGDVDVTSIIPGTGATNLGKAEDGLHSSGDVGVMALAVANEANTARAADGDYVPIATDTEGNVRTVGNRDHDATDAGEPVKIGGRADTTFQTAVADGDRVDALFDVYGHLRVRNDHANLWSYHEDSSSALTDTSVQAAPGAGLSVYIQTIVVSTGSATAFNIFFEEGASKILGPYYLEAVSGRGLVINFNPPKKCTANTAVTVTTSAAIAHSIDMTGFIAP